MPPVVHALLVGISAYPDDLPALLGGRHDAVRLEAALRDRLGTSGTTLSATVLLDAAATRDAVVAGLRSIAATAAPGDAAMFWFSGYGSQQETAPEHGGDTRPGLEDTLVLADSRAPGGADLSTAELAVLAGEVTSRGVPLWLGLDCCHSGSGTAARLDRDGTVRRAPTRRGDQASRRALSASALSASALSASALSASALDPSALDPPATGPTLAGPGRVLLTAARADRSARAVPSPDGHGGALSLAVESVLSDPATGNPAFGYRHLHRSVTAVLRGIVDDQTPQLWCDPPAAADAPLLGGLLGAPARHPSVPDRLPDVTVLVDLAVPHRDALLAVLAQGAGLSVVDAPPAVLTVCATPEGGGGLVVTRPGATRPLLAPRPLPADGSPWPGRDLVELRDQLAHLGRWIGLASLRRPASALGADAVTLEVLDTDDVPLPADPDGRVRVEWLPERHAFPQIRIRVTNHSPARLFVGVLALTGAFGVRPLLDGDGEWLEPGAATFVPGPSGGRDFAAVPPDGELVGTDVLLLLAGTDAFATRSLAQPDLGAPGADAGTRDLRGAQRGLSAQRPEGGPQHARDWTTRTVELTTYRVGDFLPVSQSVVTRLAGDALLAPHPALRGWVRVSPSTQAARCSPVPLLPDLLVDDPCTEPFPLLAGRAVGGEVDVLEVRLADDADPAVVTPQAPLVVTTPRRLPPGAWVLPIAFDGADHLPVGVGQTDGNGDGTRITVTRLPVHDPATARGPEGALRILLRTVPPDPPCPAADDLVRLEPEAVSLEPEAVLLDHEAHQVVRLEPEAGAVRSS